MLTVLIWLGSGFAFAVGVFVGAWLMNSIRGKDSDAEKMYQERHDEILRQFVQSNSHRRDMSIALGRLMERFEKDVLQD